ncbi:oxygen-independent coproporphyrinogen-3 oxidase [Tistlia consotensis]|uniref:Heme chaperone HemW n=1 Tax=Tistlia consotensis USBA 355 TaxID=560819 RepID=A0A1Y6BLG0_9PROT|nr:radical SAM family heme chaperone HemW [Tistlia consotensis]SMF08679.1 oxygen-independent coproporphyrinogen-3 oxidase [Tistlia consotensis USBA 355]SNR35257.1 oxygen-independent coproporphyrinogen-3 oxidase [Tistlia consotensis]
MAEPPPGRGPEGRGEGQSGLGLYVHWPFCLSKCPYCDFNSHVRETIEQARWRAALLRELEHWAAACESGAGPRRLASIFFGGGTPSLMDPGTVAALIDRARALWPHGPDLEITLEANPTSVEAGRFAALAEAGVNRVSLGVQSLDETALRFLGRRHSAAEALAAVALARRSFPRFSFDLIYARPGQSAEAWRDELGRALDEGPEHLSLYQLTIEENTPFHGAWRRGELQPLDEEAAADLFDETQQRLEAVGLPAYEISNHARPGAECRHNQLYWRYDDYLGVGPGAHGRLTLDGRKLATRQHRAPEAWLAAVEAEGHATRTRQPLDPVQRLDELLVMGLRTREGIARAAFRREAGAEPEALFSGRTLEQLQEAGYLALDAAGLRATAEGRRRLDAVLRHLAAGQRPAAEAAKAPA